MVIYSPSAVSFSTNPLISLGLLSILSFPAFFSSTQQHAPANISFFSDWRVMEKSEDIVVTKLFETIQIKIFLNRNHYPLVFSKKTIDFMKDYLFCPSTQKLQLASTRKKLFHPRKFNFVGDKKINYFQLSLLLLVYFGRCKLHSLSKRVSSVMVIDVVQLLSIVYHFMTVIEMLFFGFQDQMVINCCYRGCKPDFFQTYHFIEGSWCGSTTTFNLKCFLWLLMLQANLLQSLLFFFKWLWMLQANSFNFMDFKLIWF